MRRARLRGRAALPRRVRTTESRHAYPLAPNRLGQRFVAARPNEVWLADLTYIPTGEGWLFLGAIIDMATRKAVGWAMRQTLHADIAIDALRMAIERRRPPKGLIRPIRCRGLPPGPCRSGHNSIHKPQGQLPRQCADAKLLAYPQGRTRAPPDLPDTGRRAPRPVRVHPRLLQSPPPPLRSRLSITSRSRANGGIAPSTFSGQDQRQPHR